MQKMDPTNVFIYGFLYEELPDPVLKEIEKREPVNDIQVQDTDKNS